MLFEKLYFIELVDLFLPNFKEVFYHLNALLLKGIDENILDMFIFLILFESLRN